MTTASLGVLQEHLYEAYASQHVDHGGDEATGLVFRRRICLLLPSTEGGPVVDCSCERRESAQLLQTDWYDTEGIDISPEQTAPAHAADVTRVCQGGFRAILTERSARHAAIKTTTLAEHLRGRIVTQNLTFAARKGMVTMKSADS